MKTISVSKTSRKLQALLKQAAHDKGLVLQTPDGREFLLAEVDQFDREVQLTRENKEIMTLLDRRGREKGGITLKEAKARLGLK